jgi:Arc/MetJ family transcription regulator
MLWSMVRRTSIEIDDALLHEAQRILGTVGVRDTVEGAWRELIRRERLAQLADDLAAGRLIDADPGLVADARRS